MNINFIPAWDQGVLKPLEKLEVHKKGLRHKAVSVFLISDYNVLIQKRASMKYHTPGLWANTCCTHPLWSEDPKECAHRRLKEELGIEVSELVYKNKIDYKADVGNGLIENENVDVFVGSIKEKDNLKILLNKDEVAEVRWICFDRLKEEISLSPDKFTPCLIIYVQDHFEQIIHCPAYFIILILLLRISAIPKTPRIVAVMPVTSSPASLYITFGEA